jgi:hypothetical protein
MKFNIRKLLISLTIFMILVVCAIVALQVLLRIPIIPLMMISSMQHSAEGRMSIWIKVVDETGKPIPEYKTTTLEIKAPWIPWLTGPRYKRKYYTTDANGIFKAKSSGAVGVIEVGDFDYDPKQNDGYFPMHQQGLVIGWNEREKMLRENKHNPLGSEENPYIYKLYIIDGYEKLLYINDKRVEPSKDFNYLCINVRTGEIRESVMPCEDIAIKYGDNKVLRHPWPDPGHDYFKMSTYQEIIAVTGEGVAPLDQDFFVRAPDSGYKKRLISPDDWQPQYTSGGVMFFFHVSDPPIYGYADISINWINGFGYISYRVNPTGQRGLFFRGYPRERIHAGHEGIEIKSQKK